MLVPLRPSIDTVQSPMSSANSEGHPITAPLAYRVHAGADAAQIASAVIGLWNEIDDALTPIIGSGGVVALYQRSLHLSAASHPWLTVKANGGDPVNLQTLLARQSAAEAAAGGSAFLHTFHSLLVSLVGPSLTERLLRPVWAVPSSVTPPQDSAS